MGNDCPRLMLAAPASGSGKTTLVVGLLQTLLARGMRPAAFKCGPDYIDPMFHREVLGVSGYNLDLFFAGKDIVRGLLRRGSAAADIAVLEGVMGYYDGVGGSSDASSWDVARVTGTPVVFAVNPAGAFLSLAALIQGFAAFRDESMVRGVVLNKCGAALFDKLAPVLERETGLRVYGHLPVLPQASLESRHLGLITPDGVTAIREKITAVAEEMEKTLDISGLLELARTADPIEDELPAVAPVSHSPVRIAVARDRAFCFYYRENLELLRELGAELVFFSPLDDAALPENVSGLYLGGGYPELYADALSANTAMRESISAAVKNGLPTLAECGGFLYLLSQLEDGGGVSRPMAGVLSGDGYNAKRLGRFGYVTVESRHDNLLCRAGEGIRAHEFHYWDSTVNGDVCRAVKPAGGGEWDCVHAGPTLFAGFPHLYFWSNPDVARRFVLAAAGEGKK